MCYPPLLFMYQEIETLIHVITHTCSGFYQPHLGTLLIIHTVALKLLYKTLLWQSYPWSWKSWLSWRTRRSNLPSVSWGSMGTHQSWMAFMTRYSRITWRPFFSLRAFFTFDARLSLSGKKTHKLPSQNKSQISHFQAQQNTNS